MKKGKIDTKVENNIFRLACMHPKDLMDFIRKGDRTEEGGKLAKVGVAPEAIFNALPQIFEARVKILSNDPEYAKQDPNVAKNVQGDVKDFLLEMMVAEQKIKRKGSKNPDFLYETTHDISGEHKSLIGFEEKFKACQNQCVAEGEKKEEFKKAAFNFVNKTTKNPHTAKVFFDKASKTQGEEKPVNITKSDMLLMVYSTFTLDAVLNNKKLFKVFEPKSRDLTVGQKIGEFFSNFVESIMLGIGSSTSKKAIGNNKFEKEFKELEKSGKELVTDVYPKVSKLMESSLAAPTPEKEKEGGERQL